MLKTLSIKLKDYLITNIQPKMYEYELLKIKKQFTEGGLGFFKEINPPFFNFLVQYISQLCKLKKKLAKNLKKLYYLLNKYLY